MKYKTGDRVEIIIGHPVWYWDGDIPEGSKEVIDSNGLKWIDIAAELVSLHATVILGTITQGIEMYSLDVDGRGKISWFGLSQIKDLDN
jgi:hypothetical protein